MSKKKRLLKQKQAHNNETAKDKSPIVHQAPKLERSVQIRQRPDLTNKQKEFLKNAVNKQVSILTGGPGTGKTFLAKHLISLFPKGFHDLTKNQESQLNNHLILIV